MLLVWFGPMCLVCLGSLLLCMHNCLFVAKPADLPRLLLRNAFEAFASFETLFPPLSAHLLASSNLCWHSTCVKRSALHQHGSMCLPWWRICQTYYTNNLLRVYLCHPLLPPLLSSSHANMSRLTTYLSDILYQNMCAMCMFFLNIFLWSLMSPIFCSHPSWSPKIRIKANVRDSSIADILFC